MLDSETALIKALLRDIHPCQMLVLSHKQKVVGVRHSTIVSTDCSQLGTCAFDEYVYVDPSLRKGGVGKALIEQTGIILSAWGVRYAFAEINDHHVMSQELIQKDLAYGISPEDRLKFWRVFDGFSG